LDFYIHLSILHGMRTEEARALGWDNVDDFHEPDCGIDIVEADRVNRRTKTESSKRGTTLCQLAVESGVRHKVQQAEMRLRAGIRWQDNDLVFATRTGGPLGAGQVRFMFRNILRTVPKEFGIVPGEWTPRDMRHTFVALMSDAGVRIEDIQREMGHDRQSTTESVYWHELKPRRSDAAKAMNEYMSETGVAGA
jgi:integrase